MGIVEKAGGWPVFDTDIPNTFLPTAEITAQLQSKVIAYLPTVEGLNVLLGFHSGVSLGII